MFAWLERAAARAVWWFLNSSGGYFAQIQGLARRITIEDQSNPLPYPGNCFGILKSPLQYLNQFDQYAMKKAGANKGEFHPPVEDIQE